MFVDTETTTILPWQKIHRPKLIVGHAHYVVLDANLKRVKTVEYSFRSVYDFWVWFCNIIPNVKTLVMYAHNWSFDYPVLDGDRRLTNMGWTIKSIIDQCPPIIINYERGEQKIQVIDSMNYFRSSLREMGNVIGAEKGDVPFNNRYSAALEKYCRRDVIILRETMLGLMDYLRSNNLSRLTHTVASLALSVYVRKFLRQKIYIDGNEERSQIGRASYFGGRTEAFRIGKFQGPFFLVDINSQYPFVMQSGKFPYRTMVNYKNVNIDDLESIMGEYAVTVVCDLKTDIPAYPLKIDNRTCFPVGTFRTHLSTPEVEYALNHGHITHVESIMLYDQDRIFYDYVNYFYNQRLKHRGEGNDVWAQLDKLLLNSLYGKFGQSHREWELTDLPPRGFPHTDHELDYDTGKMIYTMEINNQVFMSVSDTEARDSFPAVAAHVTAAARMMLQQTMDFVGHENVYYCDTDSLLLNQIGFNKLEPNIDDSRLGAWALEDVYDEIEIFGAKDYRFGTREKHKGVRRGAPEVRPGVYQQLQFATLRGCVISEDLSSPIIRNTMKRLHRRYKKGRLQPDGSVVPFVVEGGKIIG